MYVKVPKKRTGLILWHLRFHHSKDLLGIFPQYRKQQSQGSLFLADWRTKVRFLRRDEVLSFRLVYFFIREIFCICYHYFLDVFPVIILCLACWRKWQLILTWNVSMYIESLCLWFMPNSENKRNKICKLCTILLAMNRLIAIYLRYVLLGILYLHKCLEYILCFY